jgi:hypothetical protein
VVARDGAGQDVTGVPVVWASSDSSIAAVDQGTGMVVGIAPGSATITAAADEISARVRLTVLTRPEPLRSQGWPADPERTADWMATGVDECFGALQSQNVYRLRALWQPQSAPDEANLKELTRILASSDVEVTVGERIDRPPAIGPEAATMDFNVPFTWREPSRGARTAQLLFRAEFVRAAGRWEMSSCRIVGTPKL